MSGIYSPTRASTASRAAGHDRGGPSDATALGIATVYQDLALCDNLDVVANLFLGREEISGGAGGVLRGLDEAAMEQQARELLRRSR